MKKYVQNFWVRFLAVLLCSITVVTATGAGILTAGIAYVGNDKGEVYESIQEILAENYAAYIYDHIYGEHDDNYEEDMSQIETFLEDKNFTCSVGKVLGDDMSADVSEKKEMLLFNNLEDESDWDYEINITEGSYVYYDVEDVLDAMRIDIYVDDGWYMTEDVITGYFFEESTGLFYYKVGAQYFVADYIVVSANGVYYDYTLKQAKDGSKVYYNSYYNVALDTATYPSWDWVEMDNRKLYIGLDDMDFANEIKIVSDDRIQKNLYTGIFHKNGDGHISYYPERVLDVYVIRIKVDDLTHTENVSNDLFFQWKRLHNDLYTNEGTFQVVLGISVIGFLLGMALLIYSANNDKDKIGFLHKVPVGIFTAAIFLIETPLIVLLGDVVIDNYVGHNGYPFNLWLMIAVFDVFAMAFFALIWLQNIITRFKTRTVIRYSEIYYGVQILKWCWNKWLWIWSKLTSPIGALVELARENIKLFTKGFVIMLCISVVEFMAILCFRWDIDIFMGLFFLEKVVEFVVIGFVLLQMQKLQEGSKRIAAGDLSEPIDTSKMFWEFKAHGENINKVSDGIALAVEDRIKSERFKTELITNVSHDIKTPLTSIINYVDLIKKEEIQDETLQEYVEVLDRQSARLKKLIEDLMEASKASTGNLAVNMEDCDIDVLLTQLIGEFEEKLVANQLEVVVQKPEHPVIVSADGRHMWRVLDNLLNNACKYSLSGTRVYVSLVQTGNEVAITFKNISRVALNIPSEELMERFVRGDSSRNTEGSGLGLSIAQSLTELMKGSMKLEIDGDLFKVTLKFQATKK